MGPAKPCSICDAPKGASDHVEFGIRACAECIEGITISDYRLRVDWDIPEGILSGAGIRHTTRSLWSRRGGSYDLDFYLLSDVLSLLAAHHGVIGEDEATTWQAVTEARDASRARAERERIDRAAEAAREKEIRASAIKAAVRARGILLKDAKICPAFQRAVKGQDGVDADKVARNVEFFFEDQARKAVWLQDWLATFETSFAPESLFLFKGSYLDVTAKEAARLETDVNIDAEAARAAAGAFADRCRRNASRIDVLHRWLRARCHLSIPAHLQALASGVATLRTRHVFSGRSFCADVNRRLATTNVVLAEIRSPKSRGALSISGLSGKERFDLHEGLLQKADDIMTYSTGPEESRVLHVVLDCWWDDVFPAPLPMALVRMHILSRAIPKPSKGQAKVKSNQSPQKSYWCGEC